MTTSTPQGPLSGLLVADFSRVLAGPYATMILGDLGAEVVKVERSGTGDDTRTWGPPYATNGMSSYYVSINRNKRSITLDLEDGHDRVLARTLAERADVLVENFADGRMEGWGLGYENVRPDNPRLVYASISGFGPKADLPGYDFLVQAMSGLMSITGEAGSPTKVGVAVVDVLTGLHTAVGILAALEERNRSGEGQRVEVNLMQSALSSLVNQASNHLTGGITPTGMGNLHPSITPYEVFDAADGRFVVAVGNDDQFRRLCQAVGRPELAANHRYATNPDRVAKRGQLHAALQEAFDARTIDEWITILRDDDIACGPINDIPGAFAEAARLGLDPVVEMGGLATPRNPVDLSRTPPGYRLPPPALGADSAMLRAWLEEE